MISLEKVTMWISSQNEKGNLRFLIIVILTWLLNFIKPVIGKTFTFWDTHDIGFVNFLYFSDSLRSGFFPLWNHFIQSGTFFPNFNNIGLFSPLQLFFVALSWVISPLYAYELMIQAVVLIGGIGAYLLCRSYTSDRLIALFGATAFAVVLVPIVGQIGVLISLSSFPWLIFACIKIMENRGGGVPRYIMLGALGALYIVSGYLWMNLINLIIAVIFSLGAGIKKYMNAAGQERKTVALNGVNLLWFFGTITLLYGGLEFPGYLSMNFNYGLFNGDYQSQEPRLRSLSLGAQGQFFSYDSIYKALVASIDPRIIINDDSWADSAKWSFGAGWIVWIIFLVTPRKKSSGQQAFWLMFMIVALMFSAGNSNFVGDLVKNIPIINANRWWYVGMFYVAIGLIFLAVIKMELLKAIPKSPKMQTFRVLLVGFLSLCLLAYFRSPVFEFALVAVSFILVWWLGREKDQVKWAKLLTALIGVNVLAIALMPYTGISWPVRYASVSEYGGYGQKIISREKQVTIERNFRRLGEGHDYVYSDQLWYLKKIPFSHGYNNLGNPYYWYVKNEPYLEHLVYVTQDVRREKTLKRKDFTSDNAFAEAMMGDALVNMGRPTIDTAHFHDLLQRPGFKWQLNTLDVEPNTASMRVTTDAPAYLIFNNVDHPGWDVYVNGQKADLIRTNRIFQGVFLERAGSYDVVFKFRPVLTIALILLPYIVLFVSLIVYMQKTRNKAKARAN